MVADRVLCRRDLDRLDPEPIVGTVLASDVFFSGDGRRIGFETRSELWSTALDGGTPRLLHANYPLRGGTWGEGDRIVVGRVGSGLWMTSAGRRRVSSADRSERGRASRTSPIAARRSRRALYDPGCEDAASRSRLPARQRQTRDLFEGTGARFVDSGHVVFGRHDKLWAVGFDLRSLQTRGVARPRP